MSNQTTNTSSQSQGELNGSYPYSYLNTSPAPQQQQQMNYQQYKNIQNFNYFQPHGYANWNCPPHQQHSSQPTYYNPNYYPYPHPYHHNFNYQQTGYNQPNSNNNNQQRNYSQNPRHNKNFKNNNNHHHHKNIYNNNNNSNNNNNRQSPKVNKQDSPENNQFYCEVCDRGFKTEKLYEEHCQTHTTCGVNGCKFTAAAKLVKIHYNNFHASGIDKKLQNLESPEEIQKYINERKRNFPSNTNVEKKIKFTNEKLERGVTLETRQFGRLKTNKNLNSNEQKQENKETDHEKETSDVSSHTEITVVDSFKKTQNKRINKKNKKKCLQKQQQHQLKNTSLINKKPTLLQQLLANEIRHERNILLQCVKYIVENNFFNKEQNKNNNNDVDVELAGAN